MCLGRRKSNGYSSFRALKNGLSVCWGLTYGLFLTRDLCFFRTFSFHWLALHFVLCLFSILSVCCGCTCLSPKAGEIPPPASSPGKPSVILSASCSAPDSFSNLCPLSSHLYITYCFQNMEANSQARTRHCEV